MSKPNLIDVTKSILSAFIGIQSKENREKDFAEGSASSYIFVGIAMTILFVLGLVFIVSLVV